MNNQAEIKESNPRVDILEQDIYEARKVLYHELFDLRMKSVSLIWDKNSPDRDFNLQQLEFLISNTEKKLESLPEIGDMESMEKEEEEIVMEEEIDVQLEAISLVPRSVNELTQQSSIPSLQDEGNFHSKPSIQISDVVEASPAGSVLDFKAKSRFLAYQEGKPFKFESKSPTAECGFMVKRVAKIEVNDFNSLNQVLKDKFDQFECRKYITDDKLNQSVLYIIEILKLSSIIFISGVTSLCVVLPNPEYGRMLFDRGKELEIDRLCLDANCGMIVLNWLMLMHDYKANVDYKLILHLGCELELLLAKLNICLFVKNGNCGDARELFDKVFLQCNVLCTEVILHVTSESESSNARSLSSEECSYCAKILQQTVIIGKMLILQVTRHSANGSAQELCDTGVITSISFLNPIQLGVSRSKDCEGNKWCSEWEQFLVRMMRIMKMLCVIKSVGDIMLLQQGIHEEPTPPLHCVFEFPFTHDGAESYCKILKLKRGYRGVKCWKRRMVIKGILTEDGPGEISGHEWLEEMLKVCSCIQLGVAELNLTVMIMVFKIDGFKLDGLVSEGTMYNLSSQIPLEVIGDENWLYLQLKSGRYVEELLKEIVNILNQSEEASHMFSSWGWTRALFLSSSTMFCWESEDGFGVSHKNYRLEVIMLILDPCIIGAKSWNMSNSVSSLTCYSLLYNGIFMSASYYKPEIEKIVIVGNFWVVGSNIDKNMEVGAWIFNRIQPPLQDPSARNQHYLVMKLSTANGTALQGKEQPVKFMPSASALLRCSAHIEISSPNSANHRNSRIIMLKCEEVIAGLITKLLGFPVNLLHIKGYKLFTRFWRELYTTVATSLQVCANHRSHTADSMEEMNIFISHNGLMRCFLLVALSDSYKVEYGKMNMCYVWVHNQEAIKSAFFRGIIRMFNFVYTGSGVTLGRKSYHFAHNHCFVTKGYTQLKTNMEEVIFPRKELQVTVFMLRKKEGLRLCLHIQAHCKEVDMKMLVYSSTGSEESSVTLKSRASINWEGLQPSLKARAQMNGSKFSGSSHFCYSWAWVLKFTFPSCISATDVLSTGRARFISLRTRIF